MMNMRNRDLAVLGSGNDYLRQFVEGDRFFPIGNVKGNYLGYSNVELQKIASNIRRIKEAGEGYVLLDFPGRFLQSDPAYYLTKEGLLDLIVFPISTDAQSISSALNIVHMLRNPKMFPKGADQKFLFMWNFETENERKGRKDWYDTFVHLFDDMDIRVASTKMRNIEILRRDPPTFGFVRNTVCWPEVNVRMRCPYVESLFEEIKAIVDGDE